jgi:hypothetical protein
MLSVVIRSTTFGVEIRSAMLSVAMQSVVMLNVAAPSGEAQSANMPTQDNV